MGPHKQLPKESTSYEDFKIDKIPSTSELKTSYSNRNLMNNSHVFPNKDIRDKQLHSVYLNYFNSESGKVDAQQQKEYSDKVRCLRNENFNHKADLGSESSPELKITVVQSDYRDFQEDVNRNFNDSLRTRSENKSIVERQNHSIFTHPSQDSGKLEKVTMPKFRSSKQDNNDLFQSLKRSHLYMGNEFRNS